MQALWAHADDVAANAKPLMDRGQGVFDAVSKTGLDAFMNNVPGGKQMLDQAHSLMKADVPGGFNLGKSCSIKAIRKPGVSGYSLESFPGGETYFMAEDKECFHCCCCWIGAGPKLHLRESSDIQAEDALTFSAHRKCPCASPEIDVDLPDGELLAGADEHTCCCLGADTDTQVRTKDAYRVHGWCCCGATHKIEAISEPGKQLGTIQHSWGSMVIEFPSDARASDKLSLVAAALLFDLRWK